jgi:hypothetical protein
LVIAFSRDDGRASYRLGMAIEANLRGEGCRLAVRADRYEPSGLATGDDPNWVSGEIELVVGSLGAFSGRVPVSFRTFELERFRDELRDLDMDHTGTATLAHLEEQFEAVVSVEAGRATIAGFVREYVGAELRYQVATDAGHIRQAANEFDALVRAFPVRD